MTDQIFDFFFPSNIYCIACGNLIDNSRPYSLCDKCIREIHWLTENTCEICGRSLENKYDENHLTKDEGINNKRNHIGRRCYECMEISHSFTKGFSCASYEGSVKEILSGLKYKGQAYYAEKIAQAMYDRSQGFINDINVDIVTPVPMFTKKERMRGYNQSDLIARSLSKMLNLPYRSDILKKKTDTVSMSGLNSEERRINLHNAFCISYNREDDISGKDVMLVDDVYTTGSTADSCGEVLNRNGASKVYVFTFASGVNMHRRSN